MGRQAFAKLIGSISRASFSSWTQTQQPIAVAAHPPPVVFVDKNTHIICQGIKGKNDTFHTEQAIKLSALKL
ncbi:succinate--coa ligase [adp-forming] subunit alpha-1 [Quercus suber]|uniref:Succinate--coa ligase [adp-forming] subunit alpha-1 n=1 Tax=Quercus suber TaxID=58331 RepID=A0AAW0M122_QUESU